MKFQALIMAVVMVFGLLALVPFKVSAVTVDADDADELARALDSSDPEIVVNITRDISTIKRMEFAKNKYVTINLNGHEITMNVAGGTNHGIKLSDEAVLTVAGPGKLNVSATGYGIWASGSSSLVIKGGAVINASTNSEKRHAVYAQDGGKLDVTNVSSTKKSSNGAYAYGSGSVINIYGDASVSESNSSAAHAIMGGSISVVGNVKSTHADGRGAFAQGRGSEVTVYGSALAEGTNGYAAYAIEGGTVTVLGDARATKADGIGAYADGNGSMVEVAGNALASGSNGRGVLAFNRGLVTVEGNAAASGRDGAGAHAGVGGKVYVRGDISGYRTTKDIIVGGIETNPDDKIVEFSAKDPVKKNVRLSAQPYNTHYWDEYNNEKSANSDFYKAYVYKRQGSTGIQNTPVPTPTPAPVPTPTPAPMPTPEPAPAPVDPVVAFTERMYMLCLSREPEQYGLDSWVGRLKDGEVSATQMAYGFFFSDEMNDKNLSNDQFTTVLYNTMLGREPDADGKGYWVSLLDAGLPRTVIFESYASSYEFTAICAGYGIKR